MAEERITWAEATKNLFEACRTNDVAGAQSAIESHANISARDDNGNEPFHEAALHDSDGVVELLLSPKVGVDINAPNAENMTAMHLAIHRNALKVLKVLANHPAIKFDIAYDEHKKHTAPYDAAYDQHLVAVHIIDAARTAREKALAARVEELEKLLFIADPLNKHRRGGGSGPTR